MTRSQKQHSTTKRSTAQRTHTHSDTATAMRERRRRVQQQAGEADVTNKLLEVRRDLEHSVNQGLSSLDVLVQQNEELKRNRDTTHKVQTGLTTGLGVLKTMSRDEKLNFMAAAAGFTAFFVVSLFVFWRRTSLLWPVFVLAFIAVVVLFVYILRACKDSFLTKLI
ncbi:hypothetical protein PTSG_02904 [Salpingoeca rosetta]|uniref:Sec20 C-terminal domain-containing protein n=1 Tax=Salpingoeca rosetta (strain ATCC 50818 / BSB-021) TaxID=946362 RepID=F2U3N9_SALR5|nr:uncharacterized protein PTSG_02904 [Salpingoeca rosetta]EGD82233.1 hypothetical protein PTSG_02904 [Salpingoeca rosetta]|eukprot:XP_004996416.1 hypothetical protein PTSG_02904 [Salpingoeca rosetta]